MARPQGAAVPRRLLSGSAHPELQHAVAAAAHLDAAAVAIERFPDGELHVRVDERIAGTHVQLLQPTGAPAERHLLEVLFIVDACRRAGARSVTLIVPYFGYARQDRRTAPGEAVGLRVVVDLLAARGVDRIITIDPHTPTLEAIATVPVTMLTAVPQLAAALASDLPPDAVLVAPDLGAVKLAERYADVLGLPVAVVRKTRISGTEVQADQVVGEVDGRTPIIVDDMISTGATVASAVRVVTAAGARHGVVVAATHGVLSAAADRVLDALPIERILVTDTLPAVCERLPSAEVLSVARLLAEALDAGGQRASGDGVRRGPTAGLWGHPR